MHVPFGDKSRLVNQAPAADREIPQNDIIVTIPVNVGHVHGKPAAIIVNRYLIRGKLVGCGLLQIGETFFRMIFKVGKKSNSSNIYLSIVFKIIGYCFGTTIYLVKVGLFKGPVALVGKNVYPVVGFKNFGKIAVIAACV